MCVADQSIGTNGQVSQAIDRKAEKGRLRCRRKDEGERLQEAVRGRRRKIWKGRSISSRSWHNQFHIDGKLQLDQITAARGAVPVVEASREMAFTAPSCEAMRSQRQHEQRAWTGYAQLEAACLRRGTPKQEGTKEG
jgi:hypothetical protein